MSRSGLNVDQRGDPGGDGGKPAVTGYPERNRPESGDFLAAFGIFKLRRGVFFVGLQTANHHVYGTDLDPGFTVGGYVLIILAQPPTSSQPGKGTLHHPANL